MNHWLQSNYFVYGCRIPANDPFNDAYFASSASLNYFIFKFVEKVYNTCSKISSGTYSLLQFPEELVLRSLQNIMVVQLPLIYMT